MAAISRRYVTSGTFPYGQVSEARGLAKLDREQPLGPVSSEGLMKPTNLLLIAGLAVAMCADAQTQAPAPQPAGWEAALKSVTEACKGETPQPCPGLSAETAVACLQGNIDKLTPSCKDAVVKAAKAALSF